MWTLICRVDFPAGSIPSRIESTHLLPPLSCSPRTLPPTPPPSLCSPPLPPPSLCAPPLPHHSVPHPSPITLFPTPPPSLCSPPLPHHSVLHPSPITLFPTPPPSLCSPPLPHHSAPHPSPITLFPTTLPLNSPAFPSNERQLASVSVFSPSLPSSSPQSPHAFPHPLASCHAHTASGYALSPGSHTLQVAAPGAFFLPVVLQVSAKHAGSFRAVVIREQGPASLSIDPLIISPFAAEEYLECGAQRVQALLVGKVGTSSAGMGGPRGLITPLTFPPACHHFPPSREAPVVQHMDDSEEPHGHHDLLRAPLTTLPLPLPLAALPPCVQRQEPFSIWTLTPFCLPFTPHAEARAIQHMDSDSEEPHGPPDGLAPPTRFPASYPPVMVLNPGLGLNPLQRRVPSRIWTVVVRSPVGIGTDLLHSTTSLSTPLATFFSSAVQFFFAEAPAVQHMDDSEEPHGHHDLLHACCHGRPPSPRRLHRPRGDEADARADAAAAGAITFRPLEW
ncbi:unnamed protein product [Closterium sp. Naga37s-1]|nr:unnamed protein product [Closterium sp. Naga37s-1]